MKNTSVQRFAVVGGPLLAFVIAASTSSIRDLVEATNVGIVLAIVVALAALVSRAAGLTTAAVAAISYNFFHTQPYHSLRIHDGKDAVIVGLLFVLGLVVSDISAWIHRREVKGDRHDRASNGAETTATLLASTQPVTVVWPTVVTTIMDQLGLADCRFEKTINVGQPLISRTSNRAADGDDGFVLPAQGAAVPVVTGATTLGYLVLTPRAGLGALWVERRVVVAFADHLAIALTYTGHKNDSGASVSGANQI